MSEFFASFSKTIDKLFQMQKEAPPAILLEGFAKVLRFGLVALCIAGAVFAVQLGISLCVKKQRKNAIAFAAVCLVCTLAAVWAFVPISAAPKVAADSAAVQTLHYITTEALAAQEKTAQENSEAAPGEQATAVNAPAPDADSIATGATDKTTSEEQDEEEPAQPDNALHRIVATQTELSDAQAKVILKLLEKTKCTRTTRMSLPQENAKNVLLRLENDKRWQILLLPDEGYVYATEDTGFLYKINDYKSFYKQMQTVVK